MKTAPSSLSLAAAIESTQGRDLSLKEMSLGAPPPRKPAKRKPGFFSEFFSGLTKEAGTQFKEAVRAGAGLPADKALAGLNAMRRELRSLNAQMGEILSKAVPRLLARRDPAADAVANSLSSQARQARAQGESALRTVDAAIQKAEEAKSMIARGKPASQAMAGLMVRKPQADQQFNQARLRLQRVRDGWREAEAKLSDAGTKPLPQKALQAAKDTGRILAETAQEAGKWASTTAQDVGHGVMGASPWVKYLPHAAVALGALYALSLLPKRSA